MAMATAIAFITVSSAVRLKINLDHLRQLDFHFGGRHMDVYSVDFVSTGIQLWWSRPLTSAHGVPMGEARPSWSTDLTRPSLSVDQNQEPASPATVVFRGTRSLCHEFGLMLEARGIDNEVHESEGTWVLHVPSQQRHRAHDEIARYSAERSVPRATPRVIDPQPGAVLGAIIYVIILLLTAYCAGIGLFGVDWLSSGDLSAAATAEWWRAVTALTLHLDQEHLLGNVLFGVVAGIAAGRLLGPGVAWASVLGAATLANYAEALIAPVTHRAVGASTAVFAALGLLAGMAWRQRLSLRERLWYRWAPLIAGVSLLTLLGAGSAHVDVLGHALGFAFGLGVGWIYSHAGVPEKGGRRLQIVTGVGAVLLVGAAWFLALSHPGSP
jgi:rhomboid protease GluP